MTAHDAPLAIFDRIVTGNPTQADIDVVRRLLVPSNSQNMVQLGKYNVNIGQGQGDIHIGDRIYQGADAEVIRAIVRSILQELQATVLPVPPTIVSVDELVQQVRSRFQDDIQRLHSTMPLLGIDHWVDLGELFVDVNILEEISSSRRSELDDLWQDFSAGFKEYSSYRSLDRIALGKHQQRVSGLTVLAKNTNLMVVGKPGSGKTTYLQHIVTECNEGQLQPHRIPVLIKLREFVDDGRSFEYNLGRYLTQQWRLSERETELVLSQGRALILLDGLDEVTGANGREISKQIKGFSRTYPQNQLIVTCRTQSQESRFERFDYVEVADFNESQVNAFTEHWFNAVCSNTDEGQAKARQFLDKLYLEANKSIRELAITPILLSLTCAVFQVQGKFYSKRSKLYEEGLELLLDKWDKSRSIERDEIYRDLSVERKQELLSYLAVKKFEQPQYVLFEQEEIEGYIAEFLEISRRDSRAVLRAIEGQHGLLIERADKVWSFSHLTFQEYFVAKWFCSQKDWENLVIQITKKYWREVFLLTIEQVQNADILLQLMKIKIDSLLAGDDKLQEFLAWVNHKASSVHSFCKSAAIRAFYSVLVESCMFINVMGVVSSYLGTNDLDRVLDLTITDFVQSFDRSVSSIRIIYDFNIDCSLMYALGFAGVFEQFIDFDLNGVLNMDTYIVQYICVSMIAQVCRSIPENHLKSSLQKLLAERPWLDVSEQEAFMEWLRNNGNFIWTQQLRNVMTEYRNIGYDWQLNRSQEEYLKQYNYANKLLAECLSSGCKFGAVVREELEETLLLPIVQIEKLKSER